MKNKIALFAAVLAAAMVVSASETTSSMAIAAANAWASANAQAFAPSGSASEAVAERDSDGSLLWWVVPFSDGGAVIVAPDTRIEPVIAALPEYSGALPSGHPLRAILTLDMKQRLSLVKDVAETSGRARLRASADGDGDGSPSADVVESANAAKAKWGELVPSGPVRLKAGYPSPFTGSRNPAYVLGLCPGFEYGGKYTHWNQSDSPYSNELDGNCYNYYTPRHAVCGCVATAGAAVMQYFGGTGPTFNVTNDCTWGHPLLPGFYYGPFTMIGATNAYDWSILPEEFGGEGRFDDGLLTREQVELLGRATYDMGVGVTMAWAEDGEGSGAATADLADAFRLYYGFADARSAVNRKIESTEDEYFEGGSALYESFCGERNRKFLYGQLRNNVPVPLGINDLVPVMGGGHAVVAVGYGLDKAGTSYTRIFMGWAGTGDAWYCLPQIDDFDFVATYVTMVSKDDRKTVPIVGRVKTASGNGAAFMEVEVRGDGGVITNVMTDANGYWATRIDETGLSIGEPEVIWSKCETNTDEEAIAVIEALDGSLSYTLSEQATVGGTTYEDAYSIEYEFTKEDIEEEQEDGSTTTYEAVVVKTTCKARQYSVLVTCAASDAVADVKVGAVAFGNDRCHYEDQVDDEDPANSTIPWTALLDSLPEPVDFDVPDDGTVVARPGTENPDIVAAEAAAEGKMMLFISGDPDTDEFKAIASFLRENFWWVGEDYVLYVIDPEADSYGLADGNPSFGVFDPTIFNSQAPNRWAFYNGRLSYFDASDGVTDEDIQRVLDDGEFRYSKLHDNIRITVASDNCNIVNGMKVFGTNPEESEEDKEKRWAREEEYQGLIAALWGNGLPDDVEGFSADSTDWLGNEVVGLGVFTNSFVDGQGVTFTAPAAVTNNNVVWVPVGWRCYALEQEEDILDLYDLWRYGDEDLWCAVTGQELLPEEFDPVDLGLLWLESDPSDPDQATEAPILTAYNDDLKIVWLWEPREVYIRAEAVNGTVSPESGWYAYSTNEEDVVVFTASQGQVGSRFLGWNVNVVPGLDIIFEDGALAQETLSMIPVAPFVLTASYTLDKGYYALTRSSDPEGVENVTVIDVNGKTATRSNSDKFSSQPGYMVVSNTAPSVTVGGKTLSCVGWTGTGSVPAHGTGNVCEFAFTENSSITWLWREEGWVDPYDDAAITFTVDAGEGAPEGEASPAAGVYVNTYTNGERIVCTAVPGITNTVDSVAVVCAGWTLTDNATGNEVASGEGSEAEITFEKNADWTLAWSWQTNELVHIVVNADRGVASAPDDYYPVGGIVEIVMTGSNGAVFDHWNGDTNDCVIAGYDSAEGYTIKIPADSDRVINAYFATAGDFAYLSICSVCTNDADGVACALGSPDPGYVVKKQLKTRGTLNLVMNDAAYTNIVGDVTNIWVCAGWKLFNVQTNLLAGDEHLLAEGDGPVASFKFSCDSTLVWIWKAPGSAERPRSPLPDTLEGPDGTAPLTVVPGSAVAKIANTAYGWWYGLYSKVSLTDPAEEWTLVPGKAELAEDDNVLITLDAVWDPAETSKFFKVIVTEEDPR